MKITRVVGIDVSLASTGLAVVHSDLRVSADTIASKGKRGDSLVQRDERLGAIWELIRSWYPQPQLTEVEHILTVLEGPSYGSAGGSAWDRAGLWWGIVSYALGRGPVAVVAPTTRAKWATGKGNADKAAVAAAMARYAPDVDIANSDEADALALAYMGAQKVGWISASGAAQYKVLDSVAWPDIPEADA